MRRTVLALIAILSPMVASAQVSPVSVYPRSGLSVSDPAVIVAKAASDTATRTQSGSVFTNTGAGAPVTITLLDNPAAGINYTFAVTAAQSLVVAPGSGEFLYLAGTASACSNLTSSTVGSGVSLIAATGGNGAIWIASGAGFTCTP